MPAVNALMHWGTRLSEHALRRFGGALLGLAFVLLSPAVQAVGEECSVSASGVVFGNYTFLSPAPTDAAGNVQVSCSLEGLVSLLVSYYITLSQGGSGSYTIRQLTNGPDSLNYNLHSTPHTSVWGDGSGGTAIVSDSYLLGLLTVTRDYPVYGRLPAGQNVPAGLYSDTITVTVTY